MLRPMEMEIGMEIIVMKFRLLGIGVFVIEWKPQIAIIALSLTDHFPYIPLQDLI